MKNNIEKRNVKQKSNDITQGLTQVTQGFTQTNKEQSVEEKIFLVIKENPTSSQAKIAKEIGISVDSVKYYIRKTRENHLITREGTSQKGKWIILK